MYIRCVTNVAPDEKNAETAARLFIIRHVYISALCARVQTRARLFRSRKIAIKGRTRFIGAVAAAATIKGGRASERSTRVLRCHTKRPETIRMRVPAVNVARLVTSSSSVRLFNFRVHYAEDNDAARSFRYARDTAGAAGRSLKGARPRCFLARRIARTRVRRASASSSRFPTSRTLRVQLRCDRA